MTQRRIDPHTATPHTEMGAGKRIKREERKGGQGEGAATGINWRKGQKLKGKETKQGQTQTGSITMSPSKTGGTHAKVQHEDSVYKGATAPPWPSSSCAPGSISASRRMSRGSCCLAPEKPNADNVEGLHSSGLGMLARPRKGTTVLHCWSWTPGLPR